MLLGKREKAAAQSMPPEERANVTPLSTSGRARHRSVISNI
jgi:hypothetical protein